jgi:hypothetical protein
MKIAFAITRGEEEIVANLAMLDKNGELAKPLLVLGTLSLGGAYHDDILDEWTAVMKNYFHRLLALSVADTKMAIVDTGIPGAPKLIVNPVKTADN